jgi:arylsulfatase A-like enzyme
MYHDPVILLDIFTTTVSAFSGELPQDRTFDGVDLMPFLRGERNDQPHDYLYWRSDYNRAVRHGRWKGIIDSRESTRKLYDLQQDKVEELDRFPSLSDQMQELENALRRWELDLQPPLWPRVMDYRFTIDGIDYYFAI